MDKGVSVRGTWVAREAVGGTQWNFTRQLKYKVILVNLSC